MKIFILMLAFQQGEFVPENWPNKGSYYTDVDKCLKAAERKLSNPTVVDARCMEVDVAFGKVVPPSSEQSIEKATMVLKLANSAKNLIK